MNVPAFVRHRHGQESDRHVTTGTSIRFARLQDVADTAQSHYKAFEFDALQVVRVNVKAGIAWAKEYPYAAYGVAGAGLLLFPGPRGFLFRNVFGAMQSQVRSSGRCKLANCQSCAHATSSSNSRGNKTGAARRAARVIALQNSCNAPMRHAYICACHCNKLKL